MAAALSIAPTRIESVFEIGNRVTTLLQQAQEETTSGHLPEGVLTRLADAVESLRSQLVRKAERDPRSLFDLDDRLIELMDRAEEASEAGQIPTELLQEINDYIEAFRTKIDRIAGYWHWQESIATICSEEADRLEARKRASERRVARLKEMLLSFMLSRGLKKLEGDKATIGLQANGTASLVIDDPLQIGERFFESSIRLTKTELQEVVYQLADGDLRCRLQAVLTGNGWEVNASAVCFALTNNPAVSGARLVKGQHLRLR